MGPFATKADFIRTVLDKTSAGWVIFAVIDKTRARSAEDDEGELAGTMAFINTSPAHLSTEIGFVLTLPQFQRTHVTTNAVGLMLQFALNSPQAGGLGFRRVEWRANSMNAASIHAAERLGFRRDAVLRWHFVFKDGVQRGKIGNGRALPPGSPAGDLGRDTVVLSICFDDWEDLGVRDQIRVAMERTK